MDTTCFKSWKMKEKIVKLDRKEWNRKWGGILKINVIVNERIIGKMDKIKYDQIE